MGEGLETILQQELDDGASDLLNIQRLDESTLTITVYNEEDHKYDSNLTFARN